MTDSIDKKTKEKPNLDVDLDAMLDDAESSLTPINEFQDDEDSDEDSIDRLLMDAGFDLDDELTALKVNDADAVNDIDLHDELDDFLGFDDFIGDFDKQEETQAVVEPEQGVRDLSPASSNERQDDEDAIDRLLINAGIDAEDMPMPVTDDDVSAFEELDEFSDFSDFNEPEIDSVPEADEPELAVAEIEESGVEDVVVDAGGELDDFSDFSDFNEPDMISVEIDEPEQNAEDLSTTVTAGLPDEIDDFSGLADDFDDTDMIQDDEIDALALAEADSTLANMQQQTAIDESANDLQDDENGIDDLLMDSGIDSEDALEQTAVKDKLFSDDADLSELADIFQLDEASDGFSNKAEEDQLAETKQSAQDEDDFLLPDFDITAGMEVSDTENNAGIKEDDLADAFGDASFLNEDEEAVQAFEPENAELKPKGDEAILESQPKQTVDTAVEDIENARTSSLVLDQDDIKKQLEDGQNKVKKARLLSYAALGFGAVALSAAAGLGVMTYGAKSEVSKLTEQVLTLEASLSKNVENNPNEEINALMNSVVQLNQQVYGFITQLKETPQFPVDLLTNRVSEIVAKQEMVSKALDMLQVKIGGGEGKITFKPLVAEPAKVEAAHESVATKEEHGHDVATIKAETQVHAPVKGGVVQEHTATKEKAAQDVTAPAKEKAKQEATPAKVEAVPESVPAKAKIQPEAVPVKPIAPPTAVLKEEPVKASKQTATVGKWGVNLVAFKQEWFAKSKAAEFARMGIFAEVIPVHEKNATMYRLRVEGFKSKAEAFSNSDRIKKALNLDSVWVSDN
ncbi:MAG: SPOR domain-containing protein [Methylobacter sp.]